MTEKSVVVKNSMDARQAAVFVQTASKYASKIQVVIDEKTVNAKSIMGTISIGIDVGKKATIIADGKDEMEAAQDLIEVLS